MKFVRSDKTPFLLSGDKVEKLSRSKAQHSKPKAQERLVANALGGKRQVGSGSQMFAKGDVVAGGEFPLLVECKRSAGSKSIRVESRWLTKITSEAAGAGQCPALEIQFDEDILHEEAVRQGVRPAEADWIMIPLSEFRTLIASLAEKTDD